MGIWFKIAMFITSFLPLWLTILFIEILSICKNDKNLLIEYTVVCLILVIFFLSLGVIVFTLRKISNNWFHTYKIEESNLEAGVTSEFLLSYILPLVAFDFTTWDSVAQFMLYFFILSFLCIRNNNVYANLLFELKGYRFYSCELKWASELSTSTIPALVISKEDLRAKKGQNIKLARLNQPFYFMSQEE